jgi:uncharacterized membrane protein YhhN
MPGGLRSVLPLLAAAAAAAAGLNWLAVARGWRRLEYLAKPAVMLALLAWLLAHGGPWPVPVLLFSVGLVCSLVGDVALMLPGDLFLAGLGAFLLAHLAYIASLSRGGLPPLVPVAVLAVPLAGVSLWLVTRISQALAARGAHGLRGPVAAYTLVLGLMVLAALGTLARPAWDLGAAALVSAGAVLFMLSDAVLAWNKFVAPVRAGPMLIIVAYHVGQMLLTAGVARQYL